MNAKRRRIRRNRIHVKETHFMNRMTDSTDSLEFSLKKLIWKKFKARLLLDYEEVIIYEKLNE